MARMQISKSALKSMTPTFSGNSLVNLAAKPGIPIWVRILLIVLVLGLLAFFLLS